jgi:uncharacterized membrane protein
MLLSFTQWLQGTGFFTYVRESSYTYPVILAMHMVVILLFGGMILMTDMRLLGLAMQRYPVSSVIDRLRIPKRCGLIAMVAFGFILFGCKAEEYYYNAWFRVKIALLLLIGVHYLIFRSGVYNNTRAPDSSPSLPPRAKLAGALSLILWTAVVCAGRGIGYIQGPR